MWCHASRRVVQGSGRHMFRPVSIHIKANWGSAQGNDFHYPILVLMILMIFTFHNTSGGVHCILFCYNEGVLPKILFSCCHLSPGFIGNGPHYHTWSIFVSPDQLRQWILMFIFQSCRENTAIINKLMLLVLRGMGKNDLVVCYRYM